MSHRVIVPGLLGGLVLVLWAFVVNGVLGFRSSLEMKRIPDERLVYEVLRARIPAPGGYVCNPALTGTGRFPDREPVYSVRYSGLGHGAAGREAFVGLLVFLAAPVSGAWLLSAATERVLSSYRRKALFFVGIGVLVALVADVARFGIGGFAMGDALRAAASDIAAWTLAGLVVAWRMRPGVRLARP
jgi:hypothetical protein